MKKTSVFKRITATYVVFIFIPSMLVFYYSFTQISNNIMREYVSFKSIYIQQEKNRIEEKFNLIDNIGSYIVFNNSMIDFLKEKYRYSLSYDTYAYIVAPIVNYAKAFSQLYIENIGIYMIEDSIPEGHGAFFRVDKINDKQWLESFIHSDIRSTWVTTEKKFAETYYVQKNSYFFVKKIKSLDGRILGFCVIEVPKKWIYKDPLNEIQGTELLYVDNIGTVIYPPEHEPFLFHEKMIGLKGFFTENNILYLYEYIETIENFIILKTPYSLYSHENIKIKVIGAILILTNFIMMAMFYFFLRKLFRRINRNIDFMDYSINNNFCTRIPIIKRDEFGQIAEKFNFLLSRINILLQRMVEKQTAYQEAQIKALQYQINPHFIYNTMGIFSGKLEIEGQYDISEAMVDFANMFRYRVNSQSPYARICEELDFIKSYFGIEKIRYEDSIDLVFDIDDEVLDRLILRLLLQPIVENSIRHGYIKGKKLTITISAKLNAEEEIVFLVTDNGKGLDVQTLAKLNNKFKSNNSNKKEIENSDSIGLKNINERLIIFYGEGYHLILVSDPYINTIVSFRIPKKESIQCSI